MFGCHRLSIIWYGSQQYAVSEQGTPYSTTYLPSNVDSPYYLSYTNLLIHYWFIPKFHRSLLQVVTDSATVS